MGTDHHARAGFERRRRADQPGHRLLTRQAYNGGEGHRAGARTRASAQASPRGSPRRCTRQVPPLAARALTYFEVLDISKNVTLMILHEHYYPEPSTLRVAEIVRGLQGIQNFHPSEHIRGRPGSIADDICLCYNDLSDPNTGKVTEPDPETLARWCIDLSEPCGRDTPSLRLRSPAGPSAPRTDQSPTTRHPYGGADNRQPDDAGGAKGALITGRDRRPHRPVSSPSDASRSGSPARS